MESRSVPFSEIANCADGRLDAKHYIPRHKIEECAKGKYPSFVCPSCKKESTYHPALSRKDNKTEIYSTCGTKEAREAFKNWRGE